jgi:hypothetical protein
MTEQATSPTPDLRIVPTDCLHAHEDHDSQRSEPLVERLRHEDYVINPPIVAPMDANNFVILDGANRCYAFVALGYPHTLVQVAPYDNGNVELSTWRHVVGGWDQTSLIHGLRQLPNVEVVEGEEVDAIAHMLLRDGRLMAVLAPVGNTQERNFVLQRVVALYQNNARLYRTATPDSDSVWSQFPDGIALFSFPHYYPADIIAAARFHAFLPPGISRHIVHGRAIRVNYPIAALRDPNRSLAEKNAELQNWVQAKLANRQVRYYAEATYQFDE